MKIVLEAFGKLRSGVMDIPESSGRIWKMVLSQPMTAIGGYSGEKIGEIPPLNATCEFEYIGKHYAINQPGEKYESAKIYVLKDIYKS